MQAHCSVFRFPDDLAKGVLPESDEIKPPEPHELYAPFDYPVHKWAMTVDANACAT